VALLHGEHPIHEVELQPAELVERALLAVHGLIGVPGQAGRHPAERGPLVVAPVGLGDRLPLEFEGLLLLDHVRLRVLLARLGIRLAPLDADLVLPRRLGDFEDHGD